MIRATSITDAGFCPRLRIGTYAAWVRVDGIPHAVRLSGVVEGPLRDNNEAELFAALCGIWAGWRRGAGRLLVQSDSLAVVAAVQGKHPRYTPLLLSELAKYGLQGVSLQAKHVKGHSTDPAARSWVNRWCDAQCRHHLQRARREHR